MRLINRVRMALKLIYPLIATKYPLRIGNCILIRGWRSLSKLRNISMYVCARVLWTVKKLLKLLKKKTFPTNVNQVFFIIVNRAETPLNHCFCLKRIFPFSFSVLWLVIVDVAAVAAAFFYLRVFMCKSSFFKIHT